MPEGQGATAVQRLGVARHFPSAHRYSPELQTTVNGQLSVLETPASYLAQVPSAHRTGVATGHPLNEVQLAASLQEPSAQIVFVHWGRPLQSATVARQEPSVLHRIAFPVGHPFAKLQSVAEALHEPSKHFSGALAGQPLAVGRAEQEASSIAHSPDGHLNSVPRQPEV